MTDAVAIGMNIPGAEMALESIFPTSGTLTPAGRRKAPLWATGGRRAPGLGGETSQAVLMSAPQLVAGGVGVAAAAGIGWAAAAIPFVGPALAGLTLWIGSMFRRGAQKEAATQIVNEIEPKIRENLQAYLDSPRTALAQQQALANFDAMWAAVAEACGDKSLGDAGKRCISERQAGGVAPWCNTADKRGCDWFTLYRDPIAADVPVSSIDGAAGSLSQQLGVEKGILAWLAIAAMIGIATAL